MAKRIIWSNKAKEERRRILEYWEERICLFRGKIKPGK